MKELFLSSTEYNNLSQLINSKSFPISAFGFNKNSFVLHSIAMAEDFGTCVILVESDSEAKEIYDLINSVHENVGLFRTLELSFFDEYSHSRHIEIERLETIYSSLEKNNYIVVSSISGLVYRMSNPEYFMDLEIHLKKGDYYSLEDVIKKLIKLGYERMDIVEAKSQFSVRGSLIDIFPINFEKPVRLDFFGDELYSIKEFEIVSQRSDKDYEEIKIRPCRESLADLRNFESVLKNIEKKIKESKNENRFLYQKVLDEIKGEKDTNYPTKLLPFLEDEKYSFFDYFNGANFLVLSFNRMIDKAKNMFSSIELKLKEDILANRMLPEQSDIYFDYNSFLKKLSESRLITFSSLKTKIKDLKPKAIVDYHFMDLSNYYGDLSSLAYDVNRWLSLEYSVLICVDGKTQMEGVKKNLDIGDIKYTETENLILNKGKVTISSFPVLNGFMTDSFKLVLLTSAELFGKRSIKKRKFDSDSKKIKAFSEIEVGDYVVHESYGIGKYLGIFLKNVDGDEKDMIKIQYSGDSVLYVPVERLESLHKYIGKDAAKVTLHSLSSKKWSKQKEKAKKAVEEVAEELIELYAKRTSAKGYAFPEDDIWQNEFEEMFPYRETEGQIRSANEIKEDMQKPYPMERLLCGDVGYGKTEVALRAIFKAITNGKQACVLVPTTILAEQHYISMSHRLSSYPVEVEVLSRFKSKKEQIKILKNLKDGIIDLIIGTHRLLSQDVEFKDLGLLVVDEEQRFGVKDKEKIKNLKVNVDSLTMTATPIPRTLNMSLIGVKDLSLIEDPPDDRFPIQTYVMEDDESIIAEAINREISRGGQIYFVHNRVNDILNVQDRIKKINPEAKVCVAHGQLPEKKLEEILLDFMAGEYDLMLCTTIIETGVDIPNVNTIIINNCDKFGLSQLYQLRGRVGRSNRLAYAYLLFPKNKVLTEQSEKRLQAIKEFSSLGSGFKLSMRDLEIRGSGNIFGMAQSGHIEAVGYEMYAKLLEDTLDNLKGNKKNKLRDCKVEFKSSAYISESYIKDYRFRLEMYKRISSIKTFEDREDIVNEMTDRFGDVPMETLNLTHISLIRSLALQAGFSLVKQYDNVVNLYYSDELELDLSLVYDILSEVTDDELNFVAEERPYYQFKWKTNDLMPIEIMELLEEIILKCIP